MDNRAAGNRAAGATLPIVPAIVTDSLTRTFGLVTALSQLTVEMPTGWSVWSERTEPASRP